MRIHAISRILIVMAHAGHGIVLIVIATLLRAITQCISVFELCEMDGETRLGPAVGIRVKFFCKQLTGRLESSGAQHQ
jgi:hypothetical protein